MISSDSEYQAIQGELQDLKAFLAQVEKAPEHPNKDLSIIGIYKKMYHLWEQLDEYYRLRLSALEAENRDRRRAGATSVALSD